MVNTFSYPVATMPVHARRAFTIVELMVVVLIGLIILSIAVPAFQSMVYSSNQSLAVNAVQASSQMARDVALSSGRDGAVVFVYDPVVGKMQIIPAVKVGTLREATTSPNGPGNAMGLSDSPYFERDVFVPAAAGETLEIPPFWMVRGYAPPGSLIDIDTAGNPVASWYTSQAYGGINETDFVKTQDQWVFPETGFFPSDAQIVGGGLDGQFDTVNVQIGTMRQSFMIRFSARTGAVSKDTNTALFINPRNSRERPFGDRPLPFEQTLRVDMAEDLEVWARRVIESSDLTGDSIAYGADDVQRREQLIGNASNDTILIKPVTRISLYDERKLSLGVGARGLNNVTQSLYLPADQNNANSLIAFDLSLFPTGISEAELVVRINQWIDGNTTYTQVGDFNLDLDDEPESRIYLIQSYTGQLQEVLR
jgi:prepilin-type N-terminal cleavage/methylation domain-containing protein